MFASILKPLKSVSIIYKKSSTWGKVLFFVILLLIAIAIFKTANIKHKEGFEQNEQFLYKTGPEVYDDFYSDIYDQLVFSTLKDDYEIGEIINKTKPTQESIILDIGSGTGHHVHSLNKKGYKAIGVDASFPMIKKAKENYPDYDFEHGDILNAMMFQPSSFTHILCLYFTLYYIKDKKQFFNNCMNWLMPGGSLVVHVVNRDQFDPILPPANPLLMLTPQRYAKERITKSNVTFEDFKYSANFDLDNTNNTAKFVEKFQNKETGKVFRKQEHQMYMESEADILDLAKDAGFIIFGKVDLIKVGYEYQYLYIFQKPA
uniref:Methyltransferase domain-containing protein n=1 Tax=viral metagenome TaxID=1070528 RepID=A0A6C0AZT6_9ZZZZ